MATVMEHLEKQKSGQRINEHGRIQISKKGWLIRLGIISVSLAAVGYSIQLALEMNEPLLVYVNLLPLHGIIYIIVGWLFYKNPATGKAGNALVSILIPVFNQKEMIKMVIDAIYDSTYKNIEVIVVNDGSTDGTKHELDKLASKYPTLKIIHKKNEGKRVAVATAFFESKGDFIVLVDSDSIVDSNAIEEFMKSFNADPQIGAVVANARVWNAHKNILTKCQDAWYDFSFNIRKAAESKFGTVFCCSGCLSGYRREAISEYIQFWVRSPIHNSEDRELTSYAFADSWAKKEMSGYYAHLPKFGYKALAEMSTYDDAEDRSLTGQSMTSWKTVYVATATVYTDVPEKLRGFLKQQERWKKGTTRVNFFISSFFWKKNPVISLIFYIEFMLTFITPFILVAALSYAPLVHQNYLMPTVYFGAMFATGVAHGVDYKLRDPTSRHWKYKPLMNLVTAFVTSWLIFPALYRYKKNQWLTR